MMVKGGKTIALLSLGWSRAIEVGVIRRWTEKAGRLSLAHVVPFAKSTRISLLSPSRGGRT